MPSVSLVINGERRAGHTEHMANTNAAASTFRNNALPAVKRRSSPLRGSSTTVVMRSATGRPSPTSTRRDAPPIVTRTSSNESLSLIEVGRAIDSSALRPSASEGNRGANKRRQAASCRARCRHLHGCRGQRADALEYQDAFRLRRAHAAACGTICISGCGFVPINGDGAQCRVKRDRRRDGVTARRLCAFAGC